MAQLRVPLENHSCSSQHVDAVVDDENDGFTVDLTIDDADARVTVHLHSDEAEALATALLHFAARQHARRYP